MGLNWMVPNQKWLKELLQKEAGQRFIQKKYRNKQRKLFDWLKLKAKLIVTDHP